MQKYYSIEVIGPNKELFTMGKFSEIPGSNLGIIGKVTGPGKYIVNLMDGQQISVRGARGIKVGDEVHVLTNVENVKVTKDNLESQEVKFKEPGLQLHAFLPLGFGGKDASASLRVYVEKKKDEFLKNFLPAIYFVFNIHTEKLGELQWSIYMKGRQVAIQVFSDIVHIENDVFKKIVNNVEKNLRDAGFHLMTPTVFLKNAFRIPEGFRLNVKG